MSKSMQAIKREMKQVSKVKHPTMVVVKDASEQSLTAVIIFINTGDSVSEAEEQAVLELRSPRTETFELALPDDFNADDYGLYWNQVYSG